MFGLNILTLINIIYGYLGNNNNNSKVIQKDRVKIIDSDLVMTGE